MHFKVTNFEQPSSDCYTTLQKKEKDLRQQMRKNSKLNVTSERPFLINIFCKNNLVPSTLSKYLAGKFESSKLTLSR